MSDRNLNHILFDDQARNHLLPFTFIRPVAEIRIGILTIREKWEKWSGKTFSHFTEDYLSRKYPTVTASENLLVNGSITPNQQLMDEVATLRCGELLKKDAILVAACMDEASVSIFNQPLKNKFIYRESKAEFIRISRPWHIFQHNGTELVSDFNILTSGRKSESLSHTNHLISREKIFAEKGVRMEFATINATSGPVYIGKDAEIMEGALIRGPFALCEGAQVKMGARIYGPTTVGSYSRVGGEIKNSVIFSFTNKVHDGYLGNSVIGDWCNIGADTNTSNLKNNLATVKLWDYVTGRPEDTSIQFCGLMMGDFSRCGINTMFNTGTVVGISTNIFGAGYPGDFIPSFSWGGAAGLETYRLDKLFETIEKAMRQKNLLLSETDREIIQKIFELTSRYRKSI
jgi:UDP-N-acetylglucosamine diphosphorylase/glucosamine-1-phosphate N-acetyltransferase